MLLYKWNFSWLMLSCSTREEKCKNSTSSRNFHSLHKTTGGESLTKTATYLNYCRMLCTYSIEYIALFQVGTILRIWECQSIKVNLMLDTSMCQLNSFTGGSHQWLNEAQIESVNHSVSNPCAGAENLGGAEGAIAPPLCKMGGRAPPLYSYYV